MDNGEHEGTMFLYELCIASRPKRVHRHTHTHTHTHTHRGKQKETWGMSGHKTEWNYRQCHVTWGTHTQTHKTLNGVIYCANVQVITVAEKVNVYMSLTVTPWCWWLCVWSVSAVRPSGPYAAICSCRDSCCFHSEERGKKTNCKTSSSFADTIWHSVPPPYF